MVALRESERCIIHYSPLSIIITELGWESVFVDLSMILFSAILAIKARPPPTLKTSSSGICFHTKC